MASIHGKNALSFRKTRTSTADSQSAIILQDYKFAHESVAGGETSINLDALVTPTSINTGIINPAGGQLAAINLKNNSNSIVIISSDKGTLQQGSWQISNSGRQINLAYETEPNEIFTVQVRTTQATANVVDADAFAITGTLLAGETDIPLGQVFKLNANPTEQIGEVILTIDGVEQLRNVNNATADVLADGNYEEVESGAQQMNLLRLNQSFPVDVVYSVKANGLIVNAEANNSHTQALESLGGQLDAIIPTLADLAGVPDTDFQAAPNNIDLKAFSDRVYENKDNIADNLSVIDKILNVEIPIAHGWRSLSGVTVNNFTASNIFARYRRVQDTAHIHVRVVVSSAATGVREVIIPSTLNFDESKLAANNEWIGTASFIDVSTNVAYTGRPYQSGPDTQTVRFYGPNTSAWGISVPTAQVSGDIIEFELEVPIEGWDETQKISDLL